MFPCFQGVLHWPELFKTLVEIYKGLQHSTQNEFHLGASEKWVNNLHFLLEEVPIDLGGLGDVI